MSVRPYRDIQRRKARRIMVGDVPVGGDAPITVQSMTNTPTSDAQATIRQIHALEEAGADIVRVSCPDEDSTAALRTIVDSVTVPIVRRKPARPACASTQATSAARNGCARLSRRRATAAAQCASASMPDRWKRNFWNDMASPAPRRWSRAA
jgi:hypothetical protein